MSKKPNTIGPTARKCSAGRTALLNSTALPALLASGAGLAGSVSGAFAAGDNAQGGDLWAPAVGASATISENDTLGALELFMPIAQDEDSVFFLDLRVNPQDLSDMSGSFGAGLQQVITPDVMLGGYAYFNSEQVDGKTFQGVTLGAQVVTSTLDVSANVYLPTSDDMVLSSTGAATGASSTPTLSLIGNQLFAITAAGQRLQVRRQMRGVDVEAGYRLRNIFGEGKSLRFSAGGYHYENPGNRDFGMTGARLGLEFEYRPSDDIYSPRFSLSGTVSHDNQNDTQWAGSVRFIVPFGGDDGTRTYGQALDPPDPNADLAPVASQALRERLGAASLRPTGVISGVDDSGPTTPETRTIPIDPATGQPIGQFAFADDANTAGQGTFEDPTTLAGAVGTAGQAGYVVALENGLAGDINSDGVTLQNGQTLVGGGSTITVLVNGTPTQFTLPGQAGIIRGTNASPTITLAENNTIRNVTVTGTGTGILASGIGGAVLEDVRVQNTGGAGVQVLNGTGTFEIKNVDITDTGGTSLSVDGGTANIQFDADSSISQSINAAALAVINGHSGTITADGDVMATDGNGLQFENADGTYAFNGTTTLNGGDASIDIGVGSDGMFAFGDSTSINNPALGGLNVVGGTANVDFGGSITNARAGMAAVRIAGAHTGTVNFGSASSITDTGGLGLFFSDADGTYTFNGTAALSGTNGVGITAGSGGTFTFGTNTNISNPSLGAFALTDSTASVTYSGSIAQNGGGFPTLLVSRHSGGTVTFDTGTITATSGAGFLFGVANGTYNINSTTNLTGTAAGVGVNGGSSGTINLANTTITDTTGTAFEVMDSTATVNFAGGAIVQNNSATAVNVANNTGGSVNIAAGVTANTSTANAVSLTNNTGVTINFNGGLNIDTTTGTGFTATGGGIVGIANAGDESITTTAGQALNLNGVAIVGSGMHFDAISSTGAADDGVDIVNVSGGSFTAGTATIANAAQDAISIDGSASAFTFGATTITMAGDEGVALNGANGDLTFNALNITNSTGRGLEIIGATNDVTINGGAITATTVPGGGFMARIEDQAASSTVTFNNLDITGAANTPDTLSLNDVAGTITLNGGVIVSLSGNDIVDINDSSATITVNSTLVHRGTGSSDGIEIDGLSGGSVTFNRSLASTGGAHAVNLGDEAANTGGTINFNGDISANGTNIRIERTASTVNFNGSVFLLSPTQSGVDVFNTSGNVTFANLNVFAAADGVSARNNTGTLTINSGTIDNTTGQGVLILNSNTAFSDLTIGGAATGAGNDITQNAIQIVNNGTNNTLNTFANITIGGGGAGDTGDVAQSAVSIISASTGVADVRFSGTNTLRSTNAALTATATNENTLVLALDGITAERGTAGFTVDVQGTGHTPTTSDIVVTSLNNLTVTGNGTSGGVLFEETSFDADGVSGGAVTQVTGSMTIGATAQRVQGDGLSFLQTGGDLNLSTLNIANSGGTGLEVDTKSAPPATTFNLVTGGGAVNTAGGAALFLDPLSGNLNFTSVTSSGSATGGATNTGASGNGSAITVDGLTGSLTIGTTSITDLAAGETGINFTNNAAGDTYSFGTLTLSSTADNLTGIDLTGTDGETINIGSGSSINLTGAGTVGLDLSDAGVDTNFTFGDGALPPGSTINAATLLDVTGYNNTGSINLVDVDFSNQTLGPAFSQNTLHFFAQNARGTGDGSSIANASSTATADAITAADTTFVAVGGSTIDVNVNGDGSFDLNANQDLVTFDTVGGSVQTGFTNPFSNIQFNNTAGSIRDTASEGRTGLSTSANPVAGVDAVVTVGENSQLTNLLINQSAGIADVGILATGSLGTVSFTNVDITGNNAGLGLTNVSGSLTADATSSIANTNGVAVDLNGGTATINYNGSIAETDANGNGIAVQNITANGITFGGPVAIDAGGFVGVNLSNNTGGTVAFTGGLNVDVSTGLGLAAQGGGTLNILASAGDESITAAGGRALFLDDVTTNITLDTITADGGGVANRGVEIDELGANSSFTVSGATSVSNFTSQGLRIEDFSQTGIDITFGQVTASGNGADGILLDDTGNATVTFGATNIVMGTTNGALGIQLEDGSSGNITFGATTISNVGGGANQTGLDIDGIVSGTVTFADLDISGQATSTTSIGIDLTNTLGNGTIQVGDTATNGQSASITNLHRGVVIGANTATEFTFGDGEGTTDRGSVIDVNGLAGSFTVDAGNGTLAASNFDFDDVTIGAGDRANMPATPGSAVFVSEAGGTIAAGVNGLSASIDTITVAAAEALVDNDQTFVFVAGTNGGTIDLTGGGVDGFTLDAGQDIDGFANGNAVSFGSLQPTNITGNLGVTGGTVTGNVVTASNSNAGATSVVAAVGAANNSIENFNIDATGFNGNDRGLFIAASTGVVTVENVDISGVTAGNFGVQLRNNAGNVTFNDVDLTGSNTGTALNVDGGSGAVTVDVASDLDGTTGRVFEVIGGTGDVTYNAAINASGNTSEVVNIVNRSSATIDFTGGITSDGATGQAALLVNNQSGGTVNFGDVSITNFGDNSADTAVGVAGSGGSVTFGDLDIATTLGGGILLFSTTPTAPTLSTTSGTIITNGGEGVELSGGAISGTLDSVTTTGNTAVQIGNASIGAAGLTIGSVTGTNGTALDIDNSIVGAGGLNITNATATAAGANNSGIDIAGLSGDGALTITNAKTTDSGGGGAVVNAGIKLANVTTTGALTIANIDIDQPTTGGANMRGILSNGGHTATLNLGTGANGVDINGAALGAQFENSHGTVNLGTGAGGLQLTTPGNGLNFGNDSTGTFNVGSATTSVLDTNNTFGGQGIAFNQSDATVIISNIDIDVAGNTDAINVLDNDNVGSFTLNGTNTIDGGNRNGLDVVNATATFNNVTIGATNPTNDDAISINSGPVGANVTLNSVNVAGVNSGDIGLNAIGSNTTISGTGNSITSDAATAINISDATIGAGGLGFDTVTVTNGGNNRAIDIDDVTTAAGAGITIDAVDVDGITGVAVDLTDIGGAGGLTINAADIDLAGGAGVGVNVGGAVGAGGVTIGNGTAGGIVGLNIDHTTGPNGIAINLDNNSGTVDIANGATGNLAIGATGPVSTGILISTNFNGTANIGNTANQASINTSQSAIFVSEVDASADINVANVNVSASGSDAVFLDRGIAGATIDFDDLAINQAGTSGAHHGIQVSNSNMAITFTNVDINAAGGSGITIDENNTLGSVTLNGTNNTIDGVNGSGVLVRGGVTSLSNLTIGGTTAVGGRGMDIFSDSVAATQVTLNSVNVAGVGSGRDSVLIQGFAPNPTVTVSGSGNSITNSNGRGLVLFETTIGAAGLGYTSVSSTNSVGDGIFINNVSGGALTIGTTAITNAANEAIDIIGTNTATLNFGDVDIAIGSGSTTALDLSNATLNGNLMATDFDVTSTAIAGTTGIDLSDTTGTGSILLGDTNTNGGENITIAGVETGVTFSAATDITLRYGDGDGTVGAGSDSAASSISAITVIGGTLSTNGNYDFEDATLTGDTSNITPTGPSFFVFDEEGTAGAGTFADPGTAAQAAAANVDVLVAVNNSGVGGSNIDLTAAGQGSINTLTLDDNQALIGLENGQSIDVADLITVSATGGAPANYQFSGLGSGGTTITGSGVADNIGPTLETSGGNHIVSLSGSAGIEGIILSSLGTGDAINATFGVGERVVLNNVFIQPLGTGHGVDIRTTGGATSVEFDDLTSNKGLILDGSGGGTLTASGNIDTLNGNANSALELNTVIIDAAGLTVDDLAQNNKTFTAIDLTNVNGGALNIGGSFFLSNMQTTAVDINGGTSDITVGSAISTTATGRSVRVRNKTAGTVTFNGNIDDNGAGIELLNNTGASIVFTGNVDVDTNNFAVAALSVSNSTVTFQGAGRTTALTSTNGTGVRFQNSGTINFNAGTATDIDAGAGLSLTGSGTKVVNFGSATSTLDTTTGLGISGVNAGTLEISGNAQVTTTTGTAVNLINTTIGAAGVTLQSVSSNGALNGIFLNSTGNTGGAFTITGVGTTAGSGGTIANAGARGVNLVNTQNINLNNLTITDPATGIDVTNVTNLDLTNVIITGAGTSASGGDAISISNLSGTGAQASVFDDVQILRTDGDNGIDISQTNGGTAELQIIGNSVIEDTSNNAIVANAEIFSTLNISVGNASAAGVGETVIIDNARTGIALGSNQGGTINATVQNTILRAGSGDASINRPGSGTDGVMFTGINAQVFNTAISGTIQLTAIGNDIDFDNGGAFGTGSSGIALGGDGTIGGSTISNNTIDSDDEFISGIFINHDGNGAPNTNTVTVNNNTINLTGSGTNQTIKGIEIEADGLFGGVSVTVTNNTINSAGANSFSAGIVAVAGNTGAGSFATVCLDIRGNNSSAPAATIDGDDYTFVTFSNATTQLEGLTGNPSLADIQTFITANDAAGASTTAGDVKAIEVGSGNFVGVVSCP
ncbi:MAG: inverse autotransporter beta domain-containing protein [Pseudomonadota bacterium]